MSDFRDQLLKAGLVSAKQATEAERKQRSQRKAKGARNVQREQEAQRRKREEQAARKAAEDRARSLANLSEEEQKALAHQVTQIADSNRADVKFGGRRRWYYVSRNERVPSVELSDAAAERLERGECALVEDVRGHVKIVTAKGAARIAELDRRWLVVWNG